MKKFTSLKDLDRYIRSEQGTAHVIRGSQNIKNALKDAANILYKMLHKQLELYYASYTPIQYERTYGLLNSLRISPAVQSGNRLSISVYFDQGSATHPSIFGGESGFVPILLNEGWEWKNNVGIHHLSYYEGFHFVENAISEFNKMNKWGFSISKEGFYKGKRV